MNKILLLIDQKENSRLLAELLIDRYEVEAAGGDEALDGDYDLCILDGVAMERLWEKVKTRKEEEEPLLLPFLVTTTRTDAHLTTRRLWQAVDDLVQTPVDKREIIAQVEVLLRARKLSQETMWSYDALARNIPGAVFIAQDDIIVYANPLARQMGNPGEKTNTVSFIELFHPEDRENLHSSYQEALARGPAACEARYTLGDQVRHADVRMVRILHRRKPAVLGIALDITEHRIADIELRKYRDHLEELVKERTIQLEDSHQTLKALLENMIDEVWFSDEKGNLTMVNNAARKAFGLEDRATSLIELKELLSLIEMHNADGQLRSAEDAPLIRSLRGEVARGEEIALDLKTGKTSYREFCSAPIRDSNGKITGAVAVVRDIGARKEMERELDERASELQRSNRELELFAYAASHDLREPLRKFTVFTNRLRIHSGPKLDEKGLDYLTRMEHAAKRMRQLIDGLLELSRVSMRSTSFGNVSLSKVIEEVKSDLELSIHETGAVIEAGPLPALEADPLNMRRLFQNLISNALKFCIKPPRIVIKSRPLDHQHEITIEDNGIGFDEQYLDMIFEPFQRLHERGAYEGVGMGLSLCQRIVSRHNGTITAKSAPGQGSTFIITLPDRQGGAGRL